MLKLRRINTCRSCNSKRLIPILSLGNLYLSEFRKDNRRPKAFPLNLILCQNCFLVQLKETTPPKLLYTNNYGYKSGINDTMKKELREIVNEAIEKSPKKRKLLVVDIGANDGTLLSFYPKKFRKVSIEPIKKLSDESKRYSDVRINDFFTYSSFRKKLHQEKADIITAISCFYDIDYPNQFIKDITKMLKKDGAFIIQQNYVKMMLERRAFDNIVHEHLEYYSLISLENLLNRHGLEIFSVKLSNINGGSFRTFICFKGARKIDKSVAKLRKIEISKGLNKEDTYSTFGKEILNTGKKIRNFIKKETKKGKIFYVYGASTRGNTLLQYFGLDNKLIQKAVERNPDKYGKRISSVGIPIVSEEVARKDRPDYMLVLPWFFKDEFLKRENEYLKQGGHFIFPLPNFELV